MERAVQMQMNVTSFSTENGSLYTNTARRKVHEGAMYCMNPTMVRAERRAPVVNSKSGSAVTRQVPDSRISVTGPTRNTAPSPLANSQARTAAEGTDIIRVSTRRPGSASTRVILWTSP